MGLKDMFGLTGEFVTSFIIVATGNINFNFKKYIVSFYHANQYL